MNRTSCLGLAGAALALSGCDPIGFGAVSIRPIYGWQDGCTPVSIGGHGFDDDISVKIGDQAIEDLILPGTPEAEPYSTKPELDEGYVVWGTTPPGAASGNAEVSVTSGGETDDIFGGFYYEACPMSAYPTALSTSTAAAGDTIGVSGCNLQPGWTVRVGNAEPVAVSSVCSTAEVTFTAPALEAGTWLIAILDTDGNELYPLTGCDTTVAYAGGGDTSDTAYDPCSGIPSLTY
jgi:hypothetical protein